MDNNNSNTPDNIGNSYPNAVVPENEEVMPTAVNADTEHNESTQPVATDASTDVVTDNKNSADNSANFENNPFANQRIQVPLHQSDNQPQAVAPQQFTSQPQMSDYQQNSVQNQFDNHPQLNAFNNNQAPHNQAPQQHFNNPPQINGYYNNPVVQNRTYQPNMVQPQFNNHPQPNGGYHNPMPQHFNNQPPQNGYYHNQAQNNFANQPQMGAYQHTAPQHFGNQPHINGYQPAQMPPRQQYVNQSATAPQQFASRPHMNNNAENITAPAQNTPVQQNPYVSNNAPVNNDIPHIEYIPYTPGTPLPQGVTPQFINGGWYYPMAIKKKKKMSTSVKVMLGIIIGLTVFFSVVLVVWTSMLTDGEGNFENFFEFDGSSIGNSDDKADANDLANPDGPEIVLEDNSTDEGSTEKAYEVLSESVVSISVYDEGEEPEDSLPTSEGTGIVISEDGYIVTNSHVILDETDSNVWVTTKSGDVYSAGIVGCDVRTDLAVLKCDSGHKWEYATFADSEQLKVGQDVVAIGSPGGSDYSSSLTRGIISALDRPLSGSAVTYIQTDTAINPGNSGGPLANMNGQVIGINTIKVVDTQYEGMGFAIPSVTIKEVADELIKNGYVTGRARLGITITEFSADLASYYDAKAGMEIASIDDDSPLKDTKAKVGDIITEIDGKSVATTNQLYDVLDEYEPGDTVELTIYRYDENDSSKNKEFTVETELLGD